MPMQRLSFTGHSGDELAARLDLPEGPHHATALFAHCFTCSKDIPAARRIAQTLAAAGVAVLRFDFTGLGHSDGEFANTDFSSNVADLAPSARPLIQRMWCITLALTLSASNVRGKPRLCWAGGPLPSANLSLMT